MVISFTESTSVKAVNTNVWVPRRPDFERTKTKYDFMSEVFFVCMLENRTHRHIN